MVTRTQLKEERRQQIEQEKIQEAADKLACKKQAEENYTKKQKRANGLLDGELGEFLRWANKQKLRTVFLSEYKCWKPGTYRSRDELYDAKFELDFKPAPDCEATKILRRKLEEEGFDTEIITECHKNYEFYGDGEMREAGGFYDEHYLRISW
jgi:hypothetical protein